MDQSSRISFLFYLFHFWRNQHAVFRVHAQFYFTMQSAQGLLFSTCSPPLDLFQFHFLFLFTYFVNIFLLMFKYSFLPFPPTPPTTLLVIVHRPFILFPANPSPFSSIIPSPLVTVGLFSISMSLVMFCLLVCFVDWVPVKGEIIWYLHFTAWLIS